MFHVREIFDSNLNCVIEIFRNFPYICLAGKYVDSTLKGKSELLSATSTFIIHNHLFVFRSSDNAADEQIRKQISSQLDVTWQPLNKLIMLQ